MYDLWFLMYYNLPLKDVKPLEIKKDIKIVHVKHSLSFHFHIVLAK